MENKVFNVNISTGTLVRLFVFVIIILALFQIRQLILVILTSIVIASFIDYILKKFGRLARFRTFSVVLIYLLLIVFLFFVFYLFAPVFITELSDFVGFIQRYLPESEILKSIQDGRLSEAKNIISNLTNGISAGELLRDAESFINNVSSGFFQTIVTIFGGFFNLILITIISFYLSIQERGVENFLRIVTPRRYENYAISLWQRTQRKIALWLQGQILLGLLMGVLTYLGLAIFGVRYALLLALLVAIFELIPFGMVLATIPAVIFAYLDGGFTLSLIVLGYFIILQQFESYLFLPLIIKQAVGISSLAIILSLIIGGTLAGFWGIVLAIPVAVAILEFVDDLEREKQIAAPRA
jgi:predicted PurR-regulated permease PerM